MLVMSSGWFLTPSHTLFFTKKQAKHEHFKRKILLSHLWPLKLWATPTPQLKTTAQHLNAPHTLIPFPRAQTNFSCFQTLSLPEPAVAIEDIHPSAQDDYDWSCHQTINLYLLSLSFFFFCECLSFPPSLSLHHFILLLFCWCAEYDEKVIVQIALTLWRVRVTTQSLFDLGEQLIPMFIRLDFWHM